MNLTKIPRDKTKPQFFVSPNTTRADLECIGLARLGFPYKTIAQQTGLSKGQVGYRLKCAGISPMDYRHGTSELAKKIMALAHEDSKEFFDTVVSKVRYYLKDRS